VLDYVRTRGVHYTAFLIVRNGVMVREAYFLPY